ncbi:MAG TPA: hypothetical protein RMG48_20090, partial [Myxococcales bacterium LLY-WYZ-16_1]|nr:hypothetical protein [Myxococcales bacterium LLY-WYZ-16_1]
MRTRWRMVPTASCGGVRDYLPQSVPLSGPRIVRWLAEASDPAQRVAPETRQVPVPPFQLFAVHYAKDIVIETEHPHWTMHEYAQVNVGGQTIWVAKDSDPAGVQVVTADLPNLETWLAEVPIPRRRLPVHVDDRSKDGRLDLTLRYQNPLDEFTTVAFSATPKAKIERKRNSSTFNHSQQAASVLLDVRRRQTKAQASVQYADEPARIRKVWGLAAVKALLEQLQGGIAAASMRVTPAANYPGLWIERPHPETPWPTRSEESWLWEGTGGTGQLTHASHGARHVLTFRTGGLAEAEVHWDGLEGPALQLRL